MNGQPHSPDIHEYYPWLDCGLHSLDQIPSISTKLEYIQSDAIFESENCWVCLSRRNTIGLCQFVEYSYGYVIELFFFSALLTADDFPITKFVRPNEASKLFVISNSILWFVLCWGGTHVCYPFIHINLPRKINFVATIAASARIPTWEAEFVYPQCSHIFIIANRGQDRRRTNCAIFIRFHCFPFLLQKISTHKDMQIPAPCGHGSAIAFFFWHFNIYQYVYVCVRFSFFCCFFFVRIAYTHIYCHPIVNPHMEQKCIPLLLCILSIFLVSTTNREMIATKKFPLSIIEWLRLYFAHTSTYIFGWQWQYYNVPLRLSIDWSTNWILISVDRAQICTYIPYLYSKLEEMRLHSFISGEDNWRATI